MSDYELYGDYTEYEDDIPKKKGPAGLIIKLVIAAACLSVVGILGFRIFLFNYYPEAMKSLYFTENLTEHYGEVGADMEALSQSYPYMYDDAEEGNFFGDCVLVVRDAGEIQCTIRYNSSVFERLSAKHGVELDPETTVFRFTLERNPESEGGVAEEIGELTYDGTKTVVMYTYRKLAFSGIDFGTGEDRIRWLRVRITIDGVDMGKEEYLIPIYHDHEQFDKFEEYELSENEVPR